MNSLKSRIVVLIICAFFVIFFSNDFGLIDIKKTAIVTAIAIDIQDDEYEVTTQIAVPEATDANTENQKAHLSGKASTIGGAIKDIGDISGWYPKLDFCNLIIIGNEVAKDNVIKVLDFFAKTLRIQDSAVVVLSENSAKEILELSTPLDNLSSFALQKVLLKTSGFDRDVVDSNVKTFVTGYYSDSSSSIMPIIKVKKQTESNTSSNASSSGGNSSSSGGNSQKSSQQSTENKQNNLFCARTTALFYKGKLVDALSEEETLAYNMLNDNFKDSSIELKDVKIGNEEAHNYLLLVKKCKPKFKVNANNNGIRVEVCIDIYCKINDQNAEYSDSTFSKNPKLPEEIIKKAETTVYSWIKSLIEKEISSNCDFLKIKQRLYRCNYRYYDKYKDSFLSVMKPEITVSVSGQK